MAFNLTEDELKAIMAEVEVELDEVLKSEKANLAKAEGSSSSSSSSSMSKEEYSASKAESCPEGSSMSKDDDEGKSPDVSASPAESSSPGGPPESSGGGDGAPPADDGSGPAPAEGAPAEGAPPMDAGAPAAPAAPAPGDLQARLSAMPPDQLRELYLAAKSALFQQMGMAQDPAAAGASPAPAAASPGASAPAGSPPALKAEGDPDHLHSDGKSNIPVPAAKLDVAHQMRSNGAKKAEGDPDKLASDGKNNIGVPGAKLDVAHAMRVKKSETEQRFDKLESENTDLKQQVQGLMKAVELVMGQPVRKAITGLSQMPRAGADGTKVNVDTSKLTKSEITSKLKDLDYSKLEKKDRDAINGWYDGRNGAEKLAHLLK